MPPTTVDDPLTALEELLAGPRRPSGATLRERVIAFAHGLEKASARRLLARLLQPRDDLSARLRERIGTGGHRLVLRALADAAGIAEPPPGSTTANDRAVPVPVKWTLCHNNPAVATYPLPEWIRAYDMLKPDDRCRLSLFLETARIAGIAPDPARAQGVRLHIRKGRLVYRMTLRLVAESGDLFPGVVWPLIEIRDEHGGTLDLVKQPDSWPESDPWGQRRVIQNELLVDFWLPPNTSFSVHVRLVNRVRQDWRPALRWPAGSDGDAVNRLPYPVPADPYIDDAEVVDFNQGKQEFTLCSVRGIPAGDAAERSAACARAGGLRIPVSFKGFLAPPDTPGAHPFLYRHDRRVGWHIPDSRSSRMPAFNPITTPKLFRYFWDNLVPAMGEEAWRLRLAGAFLEWLPDYIGEGFHVPIGLERRLSRPPRRTGRARLVGPPAPETTPGAGAASRAAEDRGVTAAGKATGDRAIARETAQKATGKGTTVAEREVAETAAGRRLGGPPATPGAAPAAATARRTKPKRATVRRSLLARIAARGNSAEELLSVVNPQVFWRSKNGKYTVYITPAGQLVGTYASLKSFVRSYRQGGRRVYARWHAHHIIEEKHLENLGIRDHFPAYEELPSVLLPSLAHSERIGSFLRRADKELKLTSVDLYAEYYSQAYRIVGAYTGLASEQAIAAELSRVVKHMLGFI